MLCSYSVFLWLLFPFVAVNASSLDDDTGLLWRWISFVVSRSGVYLVGVLFLVFSFVATALKNKLDISPETEALMPILNPWEKARVAQHGFNTIGIVGYHNDDIESIKQRLREAEVTVNALKVELEETQRTKISLENSLEEMERDRSISEDQLLKTKMEGAIELDTLRKENDALEQQLERARTEVGALNKQIEALRREVRISEAALRDQQNLTERLESTRSELEVVTAQLKGMKMERNTAVRLASEQICIASGKPLHRRQAIEEMVDVELQRMMKENRSVERNSSLLMTAPTVEVNTDTRTEEDSSNCNRSEANKHRNAVGDAPSVTLPCPDESYNLTSETSTYSNFDRTGSTSEDCSDEDNDSLRIVTGSPAFRAFLRNAYSR